MKGELTDHAVKKAYLLLNLSISIFKKPVKEKGIVILTLLKGVFLKGLLALIILRFSIQSLYRKVMI